MDSKRLYSTFLLTICCLIFVQGGILDRIQKLIEKRKLDKAEEIILKDLEKDTLNPGAHYFYSIIYVDTAFSRYNIDSARIRINLAMEHYELTPVDDLKDLRKSDLTKLDFFKQKEVVTELAYNRAVNEMQIPSFEKFLKEYPEASYLERAVKYRDSLAYEQVLVKDTWQSYEGYFKTYPKSAYASVANERYQVLLFKDYTKDDRLESYISFLKEHPKTPFRRTAEEVILRRSTVDHHWNSYAKFLSTYPNTHLRKRIGDILYYIYKSDSSYSLEQVLDIHSNPDSLKRINILENEILFPVYEKGLFTFLTLDGEQLLEARFTDIEKSYLCGNVTSEWLAVTGTSTTLAIARNGMEIHYNVGDLEEVGVNAILSKENGALYHKSGFLLAEPVSEANALSNGWIAYRHNDKWGIVTLNGYQILEPSADAIGPAGDFIVLEKQGLFALTSADRILSGEKEFRYFLDDYEVIEDTLIQGFSGDEECLMDQKFNFIIPLDKHSIYVNNSFWYKKDDNGYQIFDADDADILNQRFVDLEVNSGWLSLKKSDGWLIVSRQIGMTGPISQLDSVKLINRSSAFIKNGDTLQVLFQNGEKLNIGPGIKLQTVKGPENQDFVIFQKENYQKLVNSEGQTLFETEYESISQLTDELYKFQRFKQYGVITYTGEQIIPPKYKVISMAGDMVVMFDVEMIGAYDLERNLLIPAEYETKIEKVGEFYQVQLAGKLGLMDVDNSFILPAEYDEFIYWNDSSVWARKADVWQLIANSGEVLIDKILKITPWLQSREESYLLILEADGVGLVSSSKGEILPAEYNEIINLGTPEQPVIFAEQPLKAAKLFVVTYFKLDGEVIKSQAFRPEEYQVIYCDQ